MVRGDEKGEAVRENFAMDAFSPTT